MRKLLVLLAVVPLMFAFTTPAKGEVNLSGYIAMETYIHDIDEPGTPPPFDDSDLIWTRDQWCSRLTFNFKEGPVGAIVEIRPATASFVRHWFGTWNFGAGTLGIGQFWTPDFSCISSAVFDCGAISGPGGDPGCAVRQNMIQLQFGNLKIAAVEPLTDAPFGYDPAVFPTPVVLTGMEYDTEMPKLIVSYNLNLAMVGLKLFAGMQSYDMVVAATDTAYSIDSTVYGVTATAGFGPATIKAMYWMAQNPVEYTAFAPPAGFPAVFDVTAPKIYDADYTSYGVDIAYAVSDTLKITAGYLMGSSELDAPGTWEDDTTTMHLNATFTLAKGVTITPEYGVIDYKDIVLDGVTEEEGEETYYGVYWKIAF